MAAVGNEAMTLQEWGELRERRREEGAVALIGPRPIKLLKLQADDAQYRSHMARGHAEIRSAFMVHWEKDMVVCKYPLVPLRYHYHTHFRCRASMS